MDVYREAVDYLESQHVAGEGAATHLWLTLFSVVLFFFLNRLPLFVAAEADIMEEDVFHEEGVSSFLSTMNIESIDLPDTPVSSPRFKHVTNVSSHSAQDPNFPIFSFGSSVFRLFNFHQAPGGKMRRIHS